MGDTWEKLHNFEIRIQIKHDSILNAETVAFMRREKGKEINSWMERIKKELRWKMVLFILKVGRNETKRFTHNDYVYFYNVFWNYLLNGFFHYNSRNIIWLLEYFNSNMHEQSKKAYINNFC